MIRARAVLAGLVALTAACGSKAATTTPSTTAANTIVFTAALSPTNEVPLVTNSEASGAGTATITLNLTRDSAGTITAATVTFQVSLTGFPAICTDGRAHSRRRLDVHVPGQGQHHAGIAASCAGQWRGRPRKRELPHQRMSPRG